MQPAELHSAFVWDCDSCGQENFCRAIEGNIDEAALAESDGENVTAHLEADDWYMNDEAYFAPVLIQRIALTPKVVKCCQCETRFKPTLPKDGPLDEDESDDDLDGGDDE